MSPKKILILVASGVAFLTLAVASGSILETNNSGNYQVKQSALSGNMTAINETGTYFQWFGTIHDYKVSDMNYFSNSDEDAGAGAEAAAINVRFNDGGTADISGSLKFKLSLKEDDQLNLHKEFKSYKAVQQDLIRQVLSESLKQTAALMKAEESYSGRRSEFITLAEAQVRDGIFETEAKVQRRLDVDGNDFIESSVEVKRDKDGKPIIWKISPLKRYNIELLQFTVKDIDFDPTIDALIAKKKEAEQAKVVAKAKAEEAKQNAITEEEQGKARIAKAKADELVEKIKAVTQAEKEFEVAQFNRQKAEEDAKANLVKKEAEAKAANLLVKAGLTPLDRANIEKETAVEVAKALATIQLPTTFITGGGNGNAVDPFTAIGLESLMNISKRMVSDTVTTPKAPPVKK